ncbi:MAG TPA: hypothetical protein VGQ83_07405 [Polyangia bacterium]|jgi:transposase-like protein
MTIFAAIGGAHGTLVEVKCTHCGARQARARGKAQYRCSTCHRLFDADAGRRAAAEERPRPPPRRR